MLMFVDVHDLTFVTMQDSDINSPSMENKVELMLTLVLTTKWEMASNSSKETINSQIQHRINMALISF